jgi:hypothetical protein
MILLGAFACLLLASIGLYGVLSCNAQSEIGLRITGATAGFMRVVVARVWL